MLQMTDRAADLLRNLRRDAKLPDEAGVRVFSEAAESGKPTLSLGFAPEPAQGDQVAEYGDMRLFVAKELAEPLSDVVLDVVAESGEPQLTFRPADAKGGQNGDGGASPRA